MSPRDDRRLQSGAALREYVKAFGYRRAGSNGEDPIFVDSVGHRRSASSLEQEPCYRGFAEALLGLPPKRLRDKEYMDGYARGKRVKS